MQRTVRDRWARPSSGADGDARQKTRSRPAAWRAATIALAIVLVPGVAGAGAVTDNILFEALDQGMWGPDKTAAFGGTKTFTAFNRSFPDRTIGDIVTSQVPGTGGTIPNPALALWFLCGGSINPLCGDRPPDTIPNPIPAQFVKNGAELRLSNMHLDFGVKGTFEIGPGSVDATVPATASIEVADTSIRRGDVVNIQTMGSFGESTLATDFDFLNVGVSPFINLTGKADLEAWVLNANVIPTTTLLNPNIHEEVELAGAKIGDGGIELRVWGESTFLPVASGIGTNIPVPGIFPPPLSTFVGFPAGDIQLYIPSLDTPPNSSFDPATNTVTNTQLPVTRVGADPTPIDFLKFDADLDVLSLLSGFPLGISGGIPLTATIELNLLDLDYGNFYSIAQNMTFTPGAMMVDLGFNELVMVETSPGTFELLSSFQVALGDDLNIIHPGGDLEITPTYMLDDNEFTNITDLLVTPGFSLAFLQLKFGGVLFTAILPETNFAVFEDFFPILDALPLNLDTKRYPLGFDPIAGSSLRISALVAAIPAPGGLGFFVIGLAGLGITLRRRRATA